MSTLTSSQMVEDRNVTRALTYSSYTLLLWDYLLTLDDEVTYIWKSPCSVVKYLFMGNRYSNLIMLPIVVAQTARVLPLDSNAACLAFSSAITLYHFWSLASLHILVMLRIWILNGRTRKITIALAAMLILYVCASIALIGYILGGITFNLNNVNSPGRCGAELAPHSWLIWMIEFCSEVCLFVSMMVTLRRQNFTSKFSRISRLIQSLYKHAVIFFLANTFSNILNIIAWTTFLRTPLYHIVNSFPIALISITGQWLAIDLRRLHVQKDVTRSDISREVEHQLAAFDDFGMP